MTRARAALHVESADFYLFAETDIPDKATANRVPSEGEATFEQGSQVAVGIPRHRCQLSLKGQAGTVVPSVDSE